MISTNLYDIHRQWVTRQPDKRFTSLKALYEFTKALQWNMTAVNPTRDVKLFRKENPRIRFLSKEECQRLYQACSAHLRPIVVIVLHTGMRRGEILNLKWDDLDFDRRLIYIRQSKSGEPREIPMSDVVFETLSRFEVAGPYVFAKVGGDWRP